jgi:hypothetical protein
LELGLVINLKGVRDYPSQEGELGLVLLLVKGLKLVLRLELDLVLELGLVLVSLINLLRWGG